MDLGLPQDLCDLINDYLSYRRPFDRVIEELNGRSYWETLNLGITHSTRIFNGYHGTHWFPGCTFPPSFYQNDIFHQSAKTVKQVCNTYYYLKVVHDQLRWYGHLNDYDEEAEHYHRCDYCLRPIMPRQTGDYPCCSPYCSHMGRKIKSLDPP